MLPRTGSSAGEPKMNNCDCTNIGNTTNAPAVRRAIDSRDSESRIYPFLISSSELIATNGHALNLMLEIGVKL